MIYMMLNIYIYIFTNKIMKYKKKSEKSPN